MCLELVLYFYFTEWAHINKLYYYLSELYVSQLPSVCHSVFMTLSVCHPITFCLSPCVCMSVNRFLSVTVCLSAYQLSYSFFLSVTVFVCMPLSRFLSVTVCLSVNQPTVFCLSLCECVFICISANGVLSVNVSISVSVYVSQLLSVCMWGFTLT